LIQDTQHSTTLAAQIEAIGFSSAVAGDLGSSALQRRFDTKFVAHTRCLPELLTALGADYRLLSAGGVALARYKTLYFDTPDYASVVAHHRGRRPRKKVRIRHHIDRQLSFLEVKLKTGAERTDKARLGLSFGNEELGASELEFLLANHLPEPAQLQPTLRTDFGRITLVGTDAERVTLDIDLSFSNSNSTKALAGLCIIEVKQARLMSRSPVMLALHQCGARRGRISKYCTAASLLVPELRLARFKPVLRAARKVING
jgi:hypothetical protein